MTRLFHSLVLCLAVGAHAQAPIDATTEWRFEWCIDHVLTSLGANRDDLTIRLDHIGRHDLALDVALRATQRPLELPMLVGDLAAELRDATRPVEVLARALDQLPRRPHAKDPSPPALLDAADWRALDAQLPHDIMWRLRDTMFDLGVAWRMADEGLSALLPEHRQRFESLLLEVALRDGLEEDSDGLQDAKEMRDLVDALGQVDVTPWLESGKRLLGAAERWRDAEPLDADGPRGVLLDRQTPAGRVLITGASNDTVVLDDEPVALLLDLGGDDIVVDRAPLHAGRARLHVDLGGDDRYVADGSGWGAALLGASVMLDRAGNDHYEGKHYACGVGVLGVGVLWDSDGNDLYHGDTMTQGAGMMGVGLLIDDAGRDRYLGQCLAQAVGLPGGVGILLDREGRDVYLAGYEYQDPLGREPLGYSTLSQGMGYGFRPYCGGGLGLLVDVKGDDIYRCDYFGQGAGYWLALGALADLDGNDDYHANRYAQGAGVHLAAGMLLDGGGDDRYESWGVSKGTGHDYAPGVLFDVSGNDRYSAQWLAMGCGNGNGVGLFYDNAGDDRYLLPDAHNLLGFGQYLDDRQAGSFGFAIDAGGSDWYERYGADNTWWDQHHWHLWGIGVDLEAPWETP